MIELRRATTLGRTSFNGVEAIHHFCFGPYQALDRVHWGLLRMLNHVCLEPKGAREPNFLGGMEVVIIVERGEVEAQCADNRVTVRAGGVLRFASNAGGEFGFRNRTSQTATFLEIWLAAERWQGEPEIRHALMSSDCTVIGSSRFRDGPAVVLRSPARISRFDATAGVPQSHSIEAAGHSYVCALAGIVQLEGDELCENDAVAVCDGVRVCVEARIGARCLVIECEDQKPDFAAAIAVQPFGVFLRLCRQIAQIISMKAASRTR